MGNSKHLFIGGLVAMGFDATGKFLLTVSHTGRGVFSTDTWERIARDLRLVYPDNGKALGIGPLEGQRIDVIERGEEQVRDAISRRETSPRRRV